MQPYPGINKLRNFFLLRRAKHYSSRVCWNGKKVETGIKLGGLGAIGINGRVFHSKDRGTTPVLGGRSVVYETEGPWIE